MENEYFLMAGKDEGFAYKDALIIRTGSEIDTEALVNSLRLEGYRIFIISKCIARIDDIADKSENRLKTKE